MPNRNLCVLLLCLSCMVVGLAGCGQKGGLYLPDAEIDATVGVDDAEGDDTQ